MSFEWVTDDTRDFMARGYLLDGETVEDRCRDVADALAQRMGPTIGDKFYEYLSEGYYSLASPIWANFGRDRGLPISCAGSWVGDSIEAIMTKASEIGVMTKHGAGTSAYLGALRPRNTPITTGGVADGPVHFAAIFETVIDVISQGNVRRGNAAIYLDVDHPDIMEFLEMREEGSPIQKLSMGVCITDAWMEALIAGDKDKRAVWARIIKKRFETGYPYIFFTDTVNRNAPDVYRDKGMKIHASNLCSEIALASSPDESFICDLSSMNLLHFDKWKDTDAVQHLVYLLDAVMEEYIEKTKGVAFLEAAHRFAVNQRALGVGTLGYHSYLQSKGLPFESFEARNLNNLMHKTISTKALEASKYLAVVYGEPPLLEGYGRRNVTLMAIAPTTSSSFILGQVSPSIEPLASNYYTKNLAKGKFTHRNPYLKALLAEKGCDTPDTWASILDKAGSVQHLDCLTDDEKEVYKTFSEINAAEIIQQAATRQQWIDQSQSLNLLIDPNAPLKDVSGLMIDAWKKGVKSLYYQRGTNPVHALNRRMNECSACEA